MRKPQDRRDFGLPNSPTFPVAIAMAECSEPKRIEFVMFYHDVRLMTGIYGFGETEDDIMDKLEEQFFIDERVPEHKKNTLWNYKFVHRIKEGVNENCIRDY